MSLQDTVSVTVNKEIIPLTVKIEADFESIPEQYHEVFLNVLTAKYYSRVALGSNPFSKYPRATKRRWWQFWKSFKKFI